MADVKLRPLADKVLVEPKKDDEKTSGGIVLPDTAKEKPQEGTVMAVGPGRLLDNGTKVPVAVNKGDVVVYSKYGGTEVSVNGNDYLILDEGSLLAVKEK